jgi:hypothetical protein
VTLPLVMPGIVSSLLISFTISLDEFIIAFFLTGAQPTLPVYIWGQLRFPGQIPVVMALGTLLVARLDPASRHRRVLPPPRHPRSRAEGPPEGSCDGTAASSSCATPTSTTATTTRCAAST